MTSPPLLLALDGTVVDPATEVTAPPISLPAAPANDDDALLVALYGQG